MHPLLAFVFGLLLLAPLHALDLQAFLDQQLAAGAKRIVIEPGRYRVTPRQGIHLRLQKLEGVEIVAQGVELVCTETVQALRVEDCRDVKLTGLTIDYDPLPFTQGKITALAEDRSWVEFALLDGYPCDDLEQRIEIYDPATGQLRREMAAWEPGFEPRGERVFRVHKRAGYRFRPAVDTEQIGDFLVTNNRSPAKPGGHCVKLHRSSGVTLEEVMVYASPCFGFLEYQCDGNTYRRCRVDRRTTDPVPRAAPRMRSLNADAFHSVEARRGPRLEECVAKYQGDDCVNIHGTYHLVLAVDGDALRIAVLGRPTIEAGDPLEFLPFAGTRPPDAVAVGLTPDAPMTEHERALIQPLHMDAQLQRRLLQGEAKCFRLAMDRAVPLAPLSAVCSGRRVGNGFAVIGCDFGFNRSRGILIKASQGEITENRITGSWMAAILVAPEFWWMEAASASDVVIRGNRITGCRTPAIEITAPGGGGQPLAAGAHRNFSLIGNVFTDSVWPNVHITSTDGLVLGKNVYSTGRGEAPERLLECANVSRAD